MRRGCDGRLVCDMQFTPLHFIWARAGVGLHWSILDGRAQFYVLHLLRTLLVIQPRELDYCLHSTLRVVDFINLTLSHHKKSGQVQSQYLKTPGKNPLNL